MLEGLDVLPWADLRHAFGPAGDVPAWIRGLVSSDADARQRAVMRLFETVWHQGTVYQASPYVVPFLQELLRSDATPDKLPIALLLADLADGVSYIDGATTTDRLEQLVRASLAKEGRDFDAELIEGRHHAEATRQAVGKDLRLLYPYLRSAESEIRWAVAAALKHYPGHRSETLPLLREALASESDPEAAEVMQSSLVALESEHP